MNIFDKFAVHFSTSGHFRSFATLRQIKLELDRRYTNDHMDAESAMSMFHEIVAGAREQSLGLNDSMISSCISLEHLHQPMIWEILVTPQTSPSPP